MAALHTWLRNTRLRLTSNQLGGLQGAKDFRVDADLHAACQADADLVCKDVEPGEGRVQDCLVSLRAAEFAACLRWQGSSAQQCSMLVHIAAEKKIVSGQASGRLRPLVPAACWACLIFTAFGNSTHLAELLRAARYLMYAIATQLFGCHFCGVTTLPCALAACQAWGGVLGVPGGAVSTGGGERR